MYQFLIIVVAGLTSLSPTNLLKYKPRVSILFAVALAWTFITFFRVLPYISKVSHGLRDAELKETDMVGCS